MSDMDNIICRSTNNPHYIFVKLLEKHKFILESTVSPVINRQKCAAANAIVEEYNKTCARKTTIRKVFKKIANMKARLKEKNFKNLTRTTKLKYRHWERMFLNMWVGHGITVFPNKLRKSSDGITVLPSKRSKPETSNPLDIRNPYENATLDDITSASDVQIKIEKYTPDDIQEKMEADDHSLQERSQFSTISSAHFTVGDKELETRFLDKEDWDEDENEKDEDDKYKSMTLDELKRVALIAQIKTIKEQEAAFRAKKELKLYKLSRLIGK